MAFKAAILVLGLILISACTDENPRLESDLIFKQGKVTTTSKEFVIPRALRKQIEEEYLEFIRRESPKVVLSDEEVLAKIPREYLDVSVYLKSSKSEVLSSHIEFKMPRGGGEIDLKDYVVKKAGSFWMSYRVSRSNAPKEDLEHLRIYFYSNTPRRKIGAEEYGLGCHLFTDVSRKLKAANRSEGLKLNATQERYMNVVGGTFYFVDFNADRKIYIAAVKIGDSRHKDLLCPELPREEPGK